eukprot:g1208.t1
MSKRTYFPVKQRAHALLCSTWLLLVIGMGTNVLVEVWLNEHTACWLKPAITMASAVAFLTLYMTRAACLYMFHLQADWLKPVFLMEARTYQIVHNRRSELDEDMSTCSLPSPCASTPAFFHYATHELPPEHRQSFFHGVGSASVGLSGSVASVLHPENSLSRHSSNGSDCDVQDRAGPPYSSCVVCRRLLGIYGQRSGYWVMFMALTTFTIFAAFRHNPQAEDTCFFLSNSFMITSAVIYLLGCLCLWAACYACWKLPSDLLLRKKELVAVSLALMPLAIIQVVSLVIRLTVELRYESLLILESIGQAVLLLVWVVVTYFTFIIPSKSVGPTPCISQWLTLDGVLSIREGRRGLKEWGTANYMFEEASVMCYLRKILASGASGSDFICKFLILQHRYLLPSAMLYVPLPNEFADCLGPVDCTACSAQEEATRTRLLCTRVYKYLCTTHQEDMFRPFARSQAYEDIVSSIVLAAVMSPELDFKTRRSRLESLQLCKDRASRAATLCELKTAVSQDILTSPRETGPARSFHFTEGDTVDIKVDTEPGGLPNSVLWHSHTPDMTMRGTTPEVSLQPLHRTDELLVAPTIPVSWNGSRADSNPGEHSDEEREKNDNENEWTWSSIHVIQHSTDGHANIPQGSPSHSVPELPGFDCESEPGSESDDDSYETERGPPDHRRSSQSYTDSHETEHGPPDPYSVSSDNSDGGNSNRSRSVSRRRSISSNNSDGGNSNSSNSLRQASWGTISLPRNWSAPYHLVRFATPPRTSQPNLRTLSTSSDSPVQSSASSNAHGSPQMSTIRNVSERGSSNNLSYHNSPLSITIEARIDKNFEERDRTPTTPSSVEPNSDPSPSNPSYNSAPDILEVTSAIADIIQEVANDFALDMAENSVDIPHATSKGTPKFGGRLLANSANRRGTTAPDLDAIQVTMD